MGRPLPGASADQLPRHFRINTGSRPPIPALSGSEEWFGRNKVPCPRGNVFKVAGILKSIVSYPPRPGSVSQAPGSGEAWAGPPPGASADQLPRNFRINTGSRPPIPALSGSEECFGPNKVPGPRGNVGTAAGILKSIVFDPPRPGSASLAPGSGGHPPGASADQLPRNFRLNTGSRPPIPALSGSEECFGRNKVPCPRGNLFKVAGILKSIVFDPPSSGGGSQARGKRGPAAAGSVRGPTSPELSHQYGVPSADSSFVGLGGVFRTE